MPRTRSLSVVIALAALAAVTILLVARRAPSEDVGAADLNASPQADVADADVSLASPDDAGSGRSEETGRASAAAAESDSSTSLAVVVRRKGSGAPVPGARVSVFDDEMEWFETDDEGRLTVDVMACSVSVAAEPPAVRGNPLLALAYDPETGEPSSETTVEIEEGTTRPVELLLHEGATITGHVVDAEGAPVPDFDFVRMHGVGNQWSRPSPMRTDANGRFRTGPLEGNWYLLSPHPEGDEVFPFERFELALGEARNVEIRLQPGGPTRVRVEVVQEGTGEPFPYPVQATIVRADGIADVAADRTESWKRRWSTGVPPIEFERDLRVATYRVTVQRAHRFGRDGALLVRSWEKVAYLEYTDGLVDPVVRVEVPRLGAIAEVRGRLTRAVPGERAFLFAKYRGKDGQEHSAALYPAPEDGAFHLEVDVDVVEGAKLVFEQRNEQGRTVLAEHVLQEGPQDVTLTPIDD
ncbi:MAG: carboxypeptidase-like regulatory domain-containing protein [Planctomycetota bacterium]